MRRSRTGSPSAAAGCRVWRLATDGLQDVSPQILRLAPDQALWCLAALSRNESLEWCQQRELQDRLRWHEETYWVCASVNAQPAGRPADRRLNGRWCSAR